jgi:hypothetical protein
MVSNNDLNDKAYYYVWLHIITITLVLIGAINWGSIGLFSYNFIDKIFKSYSIYIYILVGIAAVHLAIKRDTYLSFLGWMAFPTSALKVSKPANSNVKVEVNVKPGVVKVLYWASNPSNNKNVITLDENQSFSSYETPQEAYDNTENVGVSEVDNNKATLHFICPSQYKVGLLFKNTLEKHVHYRMLYANGWLSNVYTTKIDC